MRRRIIVVFIVFIIMFLLYMNNKPQPRMPRVITVAALPFVNLSEDPQIDWIGMGCASGITSKISKVGNIRGCSISNIRYVMNEMKLQDKSVNEPVVAAKLGRVAGTKYVVVGSYTKDAENIKVDAIVINTKNPTSTKRISVSGCLNSIFDLQTDLTKQVVNAIGAKISESEAIDISKYPTKSIDAYIHFIKGRIFDVRDLRDESIRAFTEAIRIDPKYSAAYCNRGYVYVDKRDYNKALTDFENVEELEHNPSSVFYERGFVYIKKKEYDKANMYFTKAIESDPLDLYAYRYRGEIYSRKGEDYKAISDCTKAVELNPDDSLSYDDRGICRSSGRDYVRAIDDFNKAIQLNPYRAFYYHDRGYAYYRLAHRPRNQGFLPLDVQPKLARDDLNMALADFDKALKIDPEYEYCYYYRGEVHADLREKEKALADYYQFLKYAPKDDKKTIEKVKQIIERLER